MNRNVLLFLWGVLSPVFLFAQTPVSQLSHAVLPDSIERTLVREYSYPATISYIETQSQHFFALNNGYGMLTLVQIDDSISVNDFIVDGDTVLFCGIGNWDRAVVGSFIVPRFFSGTMPYSVTQPHLPCLSGHIKRFDKLISYHIGSERMVLLIGQTITNLYCLYEMRIPSGSNIGYCRVGELSSAYNQKILCIEQTDNYVITAGFTGSGIALPVIRVHDKNDVFSTLGRQDTMSYYAPDSVVIHHDNSQMLITHIANEFFLLAAYSRDYKSGITNLANNGTVYMAFNVNASKVAMPYLFRYSYHKNYSKQWKLWGLTKPNSLTDTYYLLQKSDILGMTNPISKVIELGYSQLLYTPLNYEYIQTYNYESIDGFNGNTQYVVNGYNKADGTQLVFGQGENPGQGGTTCMQSDTASIRPYTMTRRPAFYPWNVSDRYEMPFLQQNGLSLLATPIITDCEQY